MLLLWASNKIAVKKFSACWLVVHNNNNRNLAQNSASENGTSTQSENKKFGDFKGRFGREIKSEKAFLPYYMYATHATEINWKPFLFFYMRCSSKVQIGEITTTWDRLASLSFSHFSDLVPARKSLLSVMALSLYSPSRYEGKAHEVRQ